MKQIGRKQLNSVYLQKIFFENYYPIKNKTKKLIYFIFKLYFVSMCKIHAIVISY